MIKSNSAAGRSAGILRHSLREYELYDGEPGGGVHGSPAVAQDGQAPVVIPVMKHALQQVEVGAFGHRDEEGPGDDLTPVDDPVGGEVVVGEPEHRGRSYSTARSSG